MTRRRIIYAAVAALLAAGLVVLLLVIADVYVHWRTQDLAGVNIRGYRGSVMPSKKPGEIRVVMLGGSTAFGWGLPSHESVPAFLERQLNASASTRFSVVNLGAPGQGAYGFLSDLEDFAYLDYDIVCLYEGYNDLGPITQRGLNNYLLWRRQSPVFRWTGYYPMLPVVLREKAQAMLNGGTVNAAPGEVEFRAGLATRAAAGAMTAVADATKGLTGSVGVLSSVPPAPSVADECIEKWRRYCGSVRDAVAWALAKGKKVIFITQPYISDAHVEQQANAEAMLRARFGSDGRFRYVNLGRAVDLKDLAMAYDGLHLVARGNEVIAAGLVDPVMTAAGLR
jgi:hypothetical protein